MATIKPKEKKIDPTPILNDLIELDRLKGKLAYYKEKEMQQRIKCAEFLTKGKPAGTYPYSIPGYKLSVKKAQNISFDWKGMIESDGYEFLSEKEQECIRFKPELIDSKFKMYDLSDLPQLSEYITIKPAAPEIKFTRIDENED